MHSHTCNCLNVRLDVSQLLAAAPAQLADQLRDEPLLADGCFWALLGPDGVHVEHACLVRHHQPAGAADWTVHGCLNCGVATHATCSRPGSAAAAISQHLLSEPTRIAAQQQSRHYSPAFRIVLSPRGGRPECAAPPAGARAHPALSAALRTMKVCLSAFLKGEELRIETAIQNFRDEKLVELKESKQRAFEESQSFTSLLLLVEDQLRLSTDAVPPATSDPEQPSQPQRALVGGDVVGVFVMEADDIEVAEETDQHSDAQDLDGPDTDDSGVEEPQPLPGRRPPADHLARSVPMRIPVPPALLAAGRQRPSELEEEVPDIDQMAASIRQLAQSLHTEPGMFADLPRPRTNTMHR